MTGICESSPPQGLFSARRGKMVFQHISCLVTDSPRGYPIGGGGIHQNSEYRHNNYESFHLANRKFIGKPDNSLLFAFIPVSIIWPVSKG